MSLKTDDIIKGVLDLAKTAQELEQVKKEHSELSQQLGQLKHNLELLKKSNKEEQKDFDDLKNEKTEYLKKISNDISVLENKRASLSSSTAPEINRLNSLKSQIESLKNEAENRNSEVENKFALLSKAQAQIEGKKSILKQIKDLADKL